MTGLQQRLSGYGPPLVLGPSLGTSHAVWEPQLPVLARTHRVLRWDLPGHGGAPAGVAAGVLPGDGSATVAQLAGLVLRLADGHGWRRFAYAGISLGGAVGLHLAVHSPERLSALALVCSSARFGDPAAWRERAALVRVHGTEPLVAATAARWFSANATAAGATAGDATAEAEPDAAGPGPAATAVTDPDLPGRLLDDLRSADPHGYAACCDALGAYDLRGGLPYVTAPTLVVSGLDDPATPPAHARELARGIPGAELTEVPRGAHLANVDRPQPVTAALHAHFAAYTDDGGRHGRP